MKTSLGKPANAMTRHSLKDASASIDRPIRGLWLARAARERCRDSGVIHGIGRLVRVEEVSRKRPRTPLRIIAESA